jgi:hypothetical protein
MKVLLAAILTAAPALFCGPAAAQSASADTVPVYDSTQIALDRYIVLKRLGIEGWTSAFWIPGHSDAESARQALVNEAARLGADGLINLQCLSRTDALFFSTGYYCYGNAIKVSNERRVKGSATQ